MNPDIGEILGSNLTLLLGESDSAFTQGGLRPTGKPDSLSPVAVALADTICRWPFRCAGGVASENGHAAGLGKARHALPGFIARIGLAGFVGG